MEAHREQQQVDLASRLINPVDFLDGMIQKHYDEYKVIEHDYLKLAERRNELKKLNEEQSKQIKELKAELKKSEVIRKGRETRSGLATGLDSDDSMTMDDSYDAPLVANPNNTQRIVMDTLDVINEGVIVKEEPLPMEIPDYPVVLEPHPIEIDGTDDETALNEMKNMVVQFHEGIQWSERSIVITKLFDMVKDDANNKIFLITCPECSKKLMICRKGLLNNNITNYEQHVINQHLF